MVPLEQLAHIVLFLLILLAFSSSSVLTNSEATVTCMSTSLRFLTAQKLGEMSSNLTQVPAQTDWPSHGAVSMASWSMQWQQQQQHLASSHGLAQRMHSRIPVCGVRQELSMVSAVHGRIPALRRGGGPLVHMTVYQLTSPQCSKQRSRGL